MKERFGEMSDEETAADRWENEGGRTQLAQQEQVDLTLSTLPPQVSPEVNNGLSLGGQSCGPLSCPDFALATVVGRRSCKSRWSALSGRTSPEITQSAPLLLQLVRSRNVEGGLLVDRSFLGVGEVHLPVRALQSLG